MFRFQLAIAATVGLLLLTTLPIGVPPQADPLTPTPLTSDAPAPRSTMTPISWVYLPIMITQPTLTPTPSPTPNTCAAIPGVNYSSLSVNPPPSDRPAEQHADLNLALRSYAPTGGFLGLVDYNGPTDPNAPQLPGLFADRRTPTFDSVYKVYNWDWGCNCRSSLISSPEVTLAKLATAPGEIISLPGSGSRIGRLNGDFQALVLYASEERITLKYTRDDNVIQGYTIHLENVCVEPSLLALYRSLNAAGRGQLPALQGFQPLGRARGTTIGVAVRDTGQFMDPRSRKDWWQGR